jgi:glycosyltransferase involved in cell wall biosynthesis
MKIGIDISQIVYQGTGVARFCRGLVDSILEREKEHDWFFFFSSLRRQLDPLVERRIKEKGFTMIKYPFPPSLLSFIANELHVLKMENLTGSLDWFITSDWTEPPSRMKKATVVHDMVFMRYPETVDERIKATQEKRLSWVKKESRVIFADSDSTKNDIVEYLAVDKSKIYVNYPGVQVVKPDQEIIEKTLKKYHLNKRFILTVGKIEPRKNLKRLIEAFTEMTTADIDLVVVGPKGWDKIPPHNKKDSIRFLGCVDDSELFSLYSSSLFFIFPSIWEGFGYPLIEAMKLGAPAASSNTSSLKEIGEGAVLLFDPFKVEEIKDAMEKMIHDKYLRETLVVKGKERAKIFSWDNYYNNIIETLINN